MKHAEQKHSDLEIARLLAGAARVVKRGRHCWLITGSAGGMAVRPMGTVSVSHGSDWQVLFLTDRRSRKTSDLRLVQEVDVTFQDEPGESYVALTGGAVLIEDFSVIEHLWRDAYDNYFPSKAERENAIFIEVSVQRMKLWIRGVTPEPFGLQPVILERGHEGSWRLP